MITKDMLLNHSSDLLRFLYRASRGANHINKYGMVKVDGMYVNDIYFKIGVEASSKAYYIFELRNLLSVRGFIKTSKDSTVDCRDWSEMFCALGIPTTNKRSRKFLKSLLIKHDMIREGTKPNGLKVMVVNPLILRKSSHTSDFCISVFKDCVLPKVDKYNTYLLYLNGLLEYSDLW
ncbi:MAG: hypothetical protein ACRCZ0_08645 [Cetobacterium sp.]